MMQSFDTSGVRCHMKEYQLYILNLQIFINFLFVLFHSETPRIFLNLLPTSELFTK